MAIAGTKHHPNYRWHRWLNRIRSVLVPNTYWHSGIRTLCKIVVVACPILYGLLQFCDVGSQRFSSGLLKDLLVEIHSHRFWVVTGLMIVQILFMTILAFFNWIRPIDIPNALVVMERAIIRNFPTLDRRNHEYRATLFRIHGCSWLGGEWAGIVCRTGEKYHRSNTVFSIDRMRPRCCTGILGACFSANGATLIPDEVLPNSETEQQDYLAKCGLSEIEFQNMHVKSVVIFTTGIRKNGKLWGFLVLDTTDPDQLPTKKTDKERLEADIGEWATFLGLLIA